VKRKELKKKNTKKTWFLKIDFTVE
jgi:hypothetical protein